MPYIPLIGDRQTLLINKIELVTAKVEADLKTNYKIDGTKKENLAKHDFPFPTVRLDISYLPL